MRRIYLSNALFTEADRAFNEKLANAIEEMKDEYGNPMYSIYVPQRNDAINDKNSATDSVMIYKGDTDELIKSDIIIAVVDGTVIDEGVASEIGWVAGFNEAVSKDEPEKKIFGLSTDVRDASLTHSDAKNKMMVDGLLESQYPYKNLYTVGCIKKFGRIFSSSVELLDHLKKIHH